MQLEESLQTHADICDAVHQVILEENRHLKIAARVPEEDFLVRKRAALAALSGSLAMVRDTAAHVRGAGSAVRSLIEKIQQTIMRTLLVDRENEQLLLKCSMRPSLAPVIPTRPSVSHLQRAYGAR